MRCLPLEVAVCSVHLCQRSDPDRHSQTIPSPLTLLENILSLLLILPRLPTHRSLLLATFCLTELHLRCRGEKKQKETSNTPAHRVSSCCLWLTLWSGVLAVIVVDVNKLAGGRKKQGCWDYGKSQNSETEKFSNPRQWLFFLSLLCLHTIADQHICSGFGLKDPLLVLFPVSLGTRVRVRIQMLCSWNDVHPFYLGAWFDPFICCLCCFCVQYKPPLDGKRSHTVQQGSHQTVKPSQIKDHGKQHFWE